MKALFDKISDDTSKMITSSYSTSFSWAVRLLAPSIRGAIYNIYGFVRLADEIVDSFEGYEQRVLLEEFEASYYKAYKRKISLNPVLHAFQETVHEYGIQDELIQAFLTSMKMDLDKSNYQSKEEYEEYIYGSAEVVGLMCLKVFVNGDDHKYEQLRESAIRLGAAFQKVNFLRDLNNDVNILNRSYFPHVQAHGFNEHTKHLIGAEIEEDFQIAYEGIKQLPAVSKFGVYLAYKYYRRLNRKLLRTPSEKIMERRVRISNPMKVRLLFTSFLRYKCNVL